MLLISRNIFFCYIFNNTNGTILDVKHRFVWSDRFNNTEWEYACKKMISLLNSVLDFKTFSVVKKIIYIKACLMTQISFISFINLQIMFWPHTIQYIKMILSAKMYYKFRLSKWLCDRYIYKGYCSCCVSRVITNPLNSLIQ